MDTEQKDILRERNRRRAGCARCGNTNVRELTTDEILRRNDTLPGLRYRTCGACGNTWAMKGKPKP